MNVLIAVVIAAVGATPAGTNLVKKAECASSTNTMARISSQSAFYDNKEGYAYFKGKVFVDDVEYQMHADKAAVVMESTNSLKRIVATGHVAITNGLRRAYGDKAVYHRLPGLVVLSSTGASPAEVRDQDEKGEERILRGKKIKFWTASRQVEVQEAWIEAPRSSTGGADMKGLLGR